MQLLTHIIAVKPIGLGSCPAMQTVIFLVLPFGINSALPQILKGLSLCALEGTLNYISPREPALNALCLLQPPLRKHLRGNKSYWTLSGKLKISALYSELQLGPQLRTVQHLPASLWPPHSHHTHSIQDGHTSCSSIYSANWSDHLWLFSTAPNKAPCFLICGQCTCNFMTSPHAGAPTSPVPTLASFLSREPTLRGFS